MYNNGLESLFVGLMAFIVITILISALVGLAFYIFQAIGLYAIAKKRGYDKPWLAWIPYANEYLTGAISDNINQCNQKKTPYRFFLLFGSIAYSVFGGFSFSISFSAINELFNNSYYDYSSNPMELIGSLGSFLISAIGIGILVVRCMALYKIFVDYDRKNSMAFLILSIVFQIHPFFLFAIRNKPSESIYYMQHPEARPQAYSPQQPVPPQGYYPQNNAQPTYQQPQYSQPTYTPPQQPQYQQPVAPQPISTQPIEPSVQPQASVDLPQQPTDSNAPTADLSDTQNNQ